MPQVAGPKTVSEMIHLGSCFEFAMFHHLLSSASHYQGVHQLAMPSLSVSWLFSTAQLVFFSTTSALTIER